MATKTKSEFVSPREAATLIGCHYETIYDWIRREKLTAYRPLGIGRGKRIKLKRSEVLAIKKTLNCVTGPQ
jgi:excisionase family DNA binding protein